MNSLLTLSNLSFESFDPAEQRPSSIISFATDTSTDTVHVQGIGTLSGRLIYAFGDVALRGIENLAIRRRLGKAMKAFPHKDDATTREIEIAYDHTLELSRFGLYHARIRKQALRVLLIQIATRQTGQLLRCLVKWPPIEIALFISEILTCMPDCWLPPGTESNDMHRDLMDVYFSSVDGTNHSASPLVDFIVTLAGENYSATQAVFNSGFLNVLVCMYASNFSHHTYSVEDVCGRKSIIEAVCSALVALSRQQGLHAVVLAHPICVLWPKNELSLPILGDRTGDRRAIWKRLGPSIVTRRLTSLRRLLQSLASIKFLHTTELSDAIIDLKEFLRDDIYGSHNSREALELISLCIKLDEPQLSKYIRFPSAPPPLEEGKTNLLPQCYSNESQVAVVGQSPDCRDILLRHVVAASSDNKPWQSNYKQDEILMDRDGSVKGGTVSALVDRLISHEHVDSTFKQTFLMTYKSFMTLSELIDMLLRRYWLQLPDGQEALESEDWGQLMQHVIQMRIISILVSMLVNEDLSKEELSIIDRIRKSITTNQQVHRFPGARRLLALIEQPQQGEAVEMIVHTPLAVSHRPSHPNSKEFLDINILDVAQQLTIVESRMYLRIKGTECFRRSREETRNTDSITAITRYSDRIAIWVQFSVLSEEYAWSRASRLKYFITLADSCRRIQNYSTMVSIIAGLNAATVRRLKRSWDLVTPQFLITFNNCEAIIDPHRNFKNYRHTLAIISPPCVPYIGVFLRTLSFVQEGSKDTLSNNFVNFGKRQKMSEVIHNITRWQFKQHNFPTLPSVIAHLERSLHATDSLQGGYQMDTGDLLWRLSASHEPGENENEKLRRLLREDGF